MTGRKRLSRVALAAPLVAVAALVVAAVAVVRYRVGEVHFASALGIFQWGIYLACAGLLLSLIGLWRARPGTNRPGLLPAALGLVLALPLVAYGLAFEAAARIYPPINDVTTDTQDPPAFWNVPRPELYPGGEVAEMQREGYPDLGPLVLDMEPPRAFELAVATARDMDWRIVSRSPAERTLEAVDATWLFGFEDNVAVRVRDVGDGARVDVRSQSRLGRVDRGVNARRIRAYLEALEARAARVGAE